MPKEGGLVIAFVYPSVCWLGELSSCLSVELSVDTLSPEVLHGFLYIVFLDDLAKKLLPWQPLLVFFKVKISNPLISTSI